MGYVWSWQLKERGYQKKHDSEMTAWQKACAEYVEHYLTPSLRMAECGWDHARFFVLNGPFGEEEYVGLFADDTDIGGRYYNVSACSKGAIAETIWKGVYA